MKIYFIYGCGLWSDFVMGYGWKVDYKKYWNK